MTRFLPDGGPLDLPVCEIEWTAAAASGQRRIRCGSTSVVVPGRQLTGSVFAMVSTSRVVKFTLDWQLESGTYISYSSVSLAMATGRWERLSFTAVPPQTAVRAQAWVALEGATVEPETVLAGAGLMVTEGPLLHPYSDGDTPGWRWLGAQGNSRSVGYPLG